jgi:hypothetical protein
MQDDRTTATVGDTTKDSTEENGEKDSEMVNRNKSKTTIHCSVGILLVLVLLERLARFL